MANTTFSGPILAGTIKNTTGTTVGTDMKNTGQVLMSQTEAVTQAATTSTTNIILPANSQLVYAKLFVSVVWNGAATTAAVPAQSVASACCTPACYLCDPSFLSYSSRVASLRLHGSQRKLSHSVRTSVILRAWNPCFGS